MCNSCVPTYTPPAAARSTATLRRQEIEAPEVALDRHDVTAREPGLVGVASNSLGPHHGPRAGGAVPDHPDRQAVEDAEAVVEPLDLRRRRGVSVLRPLVADEDDPVLGESSPRTSQNLNRKRRPASSAPAASRS